jgi:hypothetical protein
LFLLAVSISFLPFYVLKQVWLLSLDLPPTCNSSASACQVLVLVMNHHTWPILKLTLVRLSLPSFAALVKIFDVLFAKSRSQFFASILLYPSEVLETIFPFLTFGF